MQNLCATTPQVIALRPKNASLATVFLQRFHFQFERNVVTRKQEARHSANPLRPFLFRPAFRRSRHLVQISLHVIIIEQAAEPSAFVANRFFDEMHPLPQTIGSVRDEQHFRVGVDRQHREIIAQHFENFVDVDHRAIENRRDRTVDVAVLVQKINAEKFRLPPLGRIPGSFFVRFRSLLVFADAEATAVDGDDDLSTLDFQCPERRIVHSKTPSLQGGGTNGGRDSREGNVDPLVGKRCLGVPQRAEGGGGFGRQVERRGGKPFGNTEQRQPRMKALAFFATFFIRCKKSGDDFDFVAAEKEDVDVPPTPDAEWRFFVRIYGFFF